MWFLEIVAVSIVVVMVFVLGLVQGEAQEREYQKNKRRIERMGGIDHNTNHYL